MPQFSNQSLRLLATATVLTILTITILLWSRDTDNAGKYIIKIPTKQTPPQTQPCSPSPSPDKPWIFDPARDANNHGLSEEQCRIAFPKLFVEIDKSANERWNRTISYKEIDSIEIGDGMVRAVVYNGEVCSRSLLLPLLSRRVNRCSYI